MKIALFPPSLEGGGVQRITLNLASGFAAHGLQTDLVLIRAEGRLLAEVPENVNIVNLNAGRALTSIGPLRRYLRESQPDVLLAASESVNLPAIWAKLLSRDLNTQVGVIVMNTFSIRQANTLYQRERLYPLLARWFYPHADYIIAIAENIRQDLAQAIGLSLERIHTVHSPVLTPNFYQRLEKPLEHPWFQDGNKPVILGVGRFVPAKDLPTLIRAFAQVREDRPARLIILGDGQDRPQLEALVGELGLDDDVSLPGFTDNLPYMQAADVFVLSSIFEGLPTVLVEALACSRAIVSTTYSGGAYEILGDGKYGEVVPMRDPAAMAAAILRALDQPPDAALLRERAQDFTMESIIEQYLELLGHAR